MNGPDDEAGDTGGEVGGESGSEMGFDLDSSVDSISRDLKLGSEQGERTQRAPDQVQQTETTQEAEPLAPPKSWAADKHELWKQLPRPAQEYYNQREKQMLDGLEQYKGDAGFARQMREIVSPYRAMLQAQGISELDATKYLLNAHYRLTNGTEAERRAAYEEIGRNIGIITGQSTQNGEQQQIDPVVQALRGELQQIKSTLSAEQQERAKAARAKADSEVQAFASDKTNLYFDEVSKDMVGFINQGFDLKEAYTKAVWGNPVTRAKELARIQTEAASNKGDAKQAEAARRATSVNTRGSEAQRTPTETRGKFLSDASMREDLRAIRNRA